MENGCTFFTLPFNLKPVAMNYNSTPNVNKALKFGGVVSDSSYKQMGYNLGVGIL
jgi:hypothetical protein